MPWCVVIGCKNNLKATKRAGKDVSYHMFPKNPQRRGAWIKSLNRPFKLNADSSYICSEHFISDDFECYSLKEKLLNIKVKRQLKKTAIPSINIPLAEDQLNISMNLMKSQNPITIDTTSNKLNNVSQSDIHHCVVPLCNNYSTNSSTNVDKIVFYKFPIDVKICEKWLEFCNCSKDKLSDYQNAVMCSEHFEDDSYEVAYTPESIFSTKLLKVDAVPTLNSGIKIINDKKNERKNLVDKLLADYEEHKKNESNQGTVTKYSSFFPPKINPNAKLGDKLKLLKAIDNPEAYSPLKKRKISVPVKPNTDDFNLSMCANMSQNKDQVIQVSAVKGGLMLHAIPQISNAPKSPHTIKNEINEEDESEEIIIVTEDEASRADLSLFEEQPKENNTEIVIVTSLKETEDILKHVEKFPKKCSTKNYHCNNTYSIQNQTNNKESQSTPLYTAKVSLNEDKECQVLIPCKGCEHRSLKINKLLRERTRLLRDLNQNGTWKDPDEINTLRKMNGVLSMLLTHCVGEKNGKKSSSIRVDLVQDSIEKVINGGWSMQDTSEALCQALSVNAYDEFARTFEIINEI